MFMVLKSPEICLRHLSGNPVNVSTKACGYVQSVNSCTVLAFTLTVKVTATTGIYTLNITTVDIMPHAVL